MKKITALILVLIMLISAVPLTAHAKEGDGYSFDESTGILTITGNDGYDNWNDYSYDVDDRYDLLSKVTEVVIAEGVTNVDSYTFNEYYTSFETVRIPKTVETIGARAFEDCPALKNVYFDYDAENKRKSLYLHEEVFSGCVSLESISLPPTVNIIRKYAFAGCTSLENVEFGYDGRSTNYSFDEYAFKGCTALESVTLPPSSLTLYGKAFYGCKNLKTVNIVKPSDDFDMSNYKVNSRCSDGDLSTAPFANTDINLVIYVPEDLEDTFKSEYMPYYADRINPAQSINRYPVSVNGEVFSQNNLVISCGGGSATFDPDSNTLTLDNAEITQEAQKYFADFETQRPAIASEIDGLSIIFIGDNRVVGGPIDEYEDENFVWHDARPGLDGIESIGSLNISGDGTFDTTQGTTDERNGRSILVNGGFTLTDSKLVAGADIKVEPEKGQTVRIEDATVISTSEFVINDYIGTGSISGCTFDVDGFEFACTEGEIGSSQINAKTRLVVFSVYDGDGVFVSDSTLSCDSSKGAGTGNVKLADDLGFYCGESFRIAPMNYKTDIESGLQIGNIDGYDFTVTEMDQWEANNVNMLLNWGAYSDYSYLSGYKIDLYKDGEKVEEMLPACIRYPAANEESTIINFYEIHEEGGSITQSVEQGLVSLNGSVYTFGTDKVDYVVMIAKKTEPKNYNVNIKSVTPENAAVTFESGRKKSTLIPEENGEYNVEADGNYESVVTVSADGYYDSVYRMNKGNEEDWSLGDITLAKIPVSRLIKVNLSSSDGRAFTDFSNLVLTLKNGTKTLRQGTDYNLNYPNIVLSDSLRQTLSDSTTLKLSIKPGDSIKLSGGSAETTLKDSQFNIQLKAFGKAEITLSGVEKSFVAIYDSNGKLADSKTAGESYTSLGLKAGKYTVVAFEENSYFSYFATLSALNASELVENTDYVKKTVTISNANISKVSLKVPPYEPQEDTYSLIDRSRTKIAVSPSNMSVGKVYNFTTYFEFSGSREKSGTLKVLLPEDSEIDSVCYGNDLLIAENDYKYNESTHILSIDFENQTFGRIWIYLKSNDSGAHTISASVTDGEIISVIGSKSYTVYSPIKLTAPVSAAKNFNVSVRTTAETAVQLSVKTSKSETKQVVMTNKAGTANARLSVPNDAVAGSKLTVTAYDGKKSDTRMVNFIGKAKASGLLSLSFKTSGGEYFIVSDGITPAKPYYAYLPTKKDDRWIITAKISGPNDLLKTGSVSLIFRLSDRSFSYVPLTVTKREKLDSDMTVYSFKGVYTQKNYKDAPLPVSVRVAFADGVHEFPGDADTEIDFTEAMGLTEVSQQIGEALNDYKADMQELEQQTSTKSIKDSDSYAALTSSEKSAIDRSLSQVDTGSVEFDTRWMFTQSYKVSDKPGFDELSVDERSEILKYEEDVEEVIDCYSAALLLKKPLTEYKDEYEALKEVGIETIKNYTGGTSGMTRVDKYNWIKQDDKKNTVTTVNTKEKTKIVTDYNKISNRVEEIYDAVSDTKKKDAASTGADVSSAETGDPYPDVTVKTIKKEMPNSSSPSKNELVTNLQYAVSSRLLSVASDYGKELFKKDLDELIKNYVIEHTKEINSGGSGVIATEKYHNAYAKLLNKEGLAKGVGYVGDAITYYGIGNRMIDNESLNGKYETLKTDEGRIDLISQVVENSNLSLEEKIKFRNDVWEYRSTIYDLKMDYLKEQNSNIGCSIVEVWCNYIPDGVGGYVATGIESYFGSDHVVRIESMGSREQLVESQERLMAQWLQRAKAAGPIKEETEQEKKTKNTCEEWVDEWEKNHNGEQEEYDIDINFTDVNPVVDPSGIVYEALEDNVLEGVTATIWYSPNEDGSDAELWNAAEYDQENPQITTVSGYAWDVPKGWWQVRFEKEGYINTQTEWLPVPPPQIDLKTAMVSAEKPSVAVASAYPDYVELEFSQYMDTSAVLKTQGYTASWIDIKESPNGKKLSKTLRLIPKGALPSVGDEVSVKLSGAINYAGTELDDYEETLTVIQRPASLKLVPDTLLQTYYLGSTEISAQVMGADGKPMKNVLVKAQAEDGTVAGLDKESALTGEDGKVIFTVSGDDIGSTKITFTVEGTAVSSAVDVMVFPNKEDLLPVALLGDADSDGAIKIIDSTVIQYHLASLNTEVFDSKAADCDGDGNITIIDATIIQQYLAKYDIPYRIGEPIV